MNKLKYKLVKVSENGTVVTRIKALKDGRFFKKGELGAIIRDFAVLDQEGDCWANYNSILTGDTRIGGNTSVVDSSIDSCILKGSGTVYRSILHAVNNQWVELYIEHCGNTGRIQIYGDDHTRTMIKKSVLVGEIEIHGNTTLDDSKLGKTTDSAQSTHDKFRLSDASLTHATLDGNIDIDDSELFRTSVTGDIWIQNSILLNDDIQSIKRKSVYETAKVENTWMTGSKLKFPAICTLSLANTVNVNDVSVCEPGKIRLSWGCDSTIVRVPGLKWYIRFIGGYGIDNADEQKDYSTNELMNKLKKIDTQYWSSASSLLARCTELMRYERWSAEKIRLNIFKWTYGIRMLMRKLSEI